ncbi:MAG TPA: aquaporin, partial [Candidatus Limnocylindrales bacterium]|nr:aquaporin [Candidatus Limnocylindrales bacterium]
MDTRKLLAELVGTFVFFLVGLMSILSTTAFPGGPDLLVIAFGFGLGLFVAINIAGAISGGHFNPAVTLAAVLDKRLDPMTGVGYVVAQLIGGIAAATFVLVMSSQAAVAATR